MDAPSIQYTKTSDGVSIAYCVGGDGLPFLRTAMPGWVHAHRDWELYGVNQSLARKFRWVLYDSRGTGLSDRSACDFSMEAMLRDLDAVRAAEGLERFALMGFSTWAVIALAYAAGYPERVSHLVLVDGVARNDATLDLAVSRADLALVEIDWVLDTEMRARMMGVDDPDFVRRLAEYLRASIEPDSYRAMNAEIIKWDASPLLSRIRAPTLVVQNENVSWTRSHFGQELAAGIKGARFVLVNDVTYDGLPALVEDFVLGTATSDRSAAPAPFRTVLFTDIVGHTEMMRRLGDERGREVLREHERITREVLKANGGTEVKTMGDGFMASFGSVVKAVECAIALQKAFDERNRGVGAEQLPVDVPVSDEGVAVAQPLRVRCGLNAGEPIQDEGDLFGSTVIMAARIAAQAEGGEILASNVVRELCSGKPFLFADRGEHLMKGFDEAVRVYEINWRP